MIMASTNPTSRAGRTSPSALSSGSRNHETAPPRTTSSRVMYRGGAYAGVLYIWSSWLASGVATFPNVAYPCWPGKPRLKTGLLLPGLFRLLLTSAPHTSTGAVAPVVTVTHHLRARFPLGQPCNGVAGPSTGPARGVGGRSEVAA